MKKLKLSLTGVFCLLALVVIVAFTPARTKTAVIPKKKETALLGQWFIYNNGFALSFSDAINPAYYRPMNVGEQCIGTQTLCAIYAEIDPINPTRPIINISQPVYTRLMEYYTYGVTSQVYIKLKNYF